MDTKEEVEEEEIEEELEEEEVVEKKSFISTQTKIKLALVIAVFMLVSVAYKITKVYQEYRSFNISKNTYQSMQNDLQAKKEELKNIKTTNENYAVTVLDDLFSYNYLLKLAYSEWDYDLYINGKNISSSTATVKAGSMTVTIIEKEKETKLPAAIHNRGSITRGEIDDKFYLHLVFEKTVKYSIEKSDADGIRKADFKIVDLVQGQSFQISLSDLLNERLKIPNQIITVEVK